MDIPKSYITDEKGSIKAVMIDFKTFKKIEGIIVDQGLAKAMMKIEDEGEIGLEEAKILLKN